MAAKLVTDLGRMKYSARKPVRDVVNPVGSESTVADARIVIRIVPFGQHQPRIHFDSERDGAKFDPYTQVLRFPASEQSMSNYLKTAERLNLLAKHS